MNPGIDPEANGPSPIDILQARVAELESVLREYRQAMDFTRQYVGYETLPAIPGWSWFDADTKAEKILNP